MAGTTTRSTPSRRRSHPAAESHDRRPRFRGSRRDFRAEIVFDARPVYDAVIGLAEVHDGEAVPADDRRWLANALASLPAPQRKIREALFGSEIANDVLALAVERPHVRTAADFAAELDALEARDVLPFLFEDARFSAELAPLLSAALEGDATAAKELSAGLSDWRRDERIRLLRDPDGTLDRLRSVFHAWAERFEPMEARLTTMLERDVALWERRRHSLEPVDLIERVTNGIRWLPEPGIRRVILAPTYFGRPYNHISNGGDWRLFVYPLSDDALDRTDRDAPPQSVMRLYRALGDETRLRILKLLSRGDRYLTEIAGELDLSKPTIKHHLAQLRAAGLVTVTDQGALTYYSLRRDTIAAAAPALTGFIGR
ncbi:MAG: metalloregulator ArsR/SmtB family transcription factor [Chloroflexota bacterium]|nr:metalloregulator ArsR/SmtB family transcription factor [Chloroflexota bacterium]